MSPCSLLRAAPPEAAVVVRRAAEVEVAARAEVGVAARAEVVVQPAAAAEAAVVQRSRLDAVVAAVLRAGAVASLAVGAGPGRALVRAAEIFAAVECPAEDQASERGDGSTVAVRASAVVRLGTLGDLAEGI
jgi:hypothetical protein